MSTIQDITFHEAENWVILFSAHDADDAALPLTSGAEIEFRISDETGEVVTLSTGEGITITDELQGLAEITLTVEQRSLVGIVAGTPYFYEIRVITDNEEASIQAEGQIRIAHSLFAATVNALLMNFRTRFPDFTEDDATVSVFLDDAARVVDGDDSWVAADRPIATVYLAAHLLQMRKLAAYQYAGGGAGEVRSIKVEDRMVSFASASASSIRSGLSQTVYGQQYLSMLRRNTIFIKRA